MLVTTTRTLLASGKTLLTPERMAEKIFQDRSLNPNHRTLPGADAEKLAWLKNVQMEMVPSDDANPIPNLHLSQDEITSLLSLIEHLKATPRDATPTDLHLERIDRELDYFERINGFKLLLSLQQLIDKFIADDVVWGVGRGSSCASYLLYLMKVHDINPIKYDISFSEFSKEL